MTAGGSPSDIFAIDSKTLFLLGNGPSLKAIDLRALAGRRTLGMNAAYRYWREIGWFPTYYACLDTVVGLSHKDAIAAMIAEAGETGIEKFLLRENLIEALGAAGLSARVVNFDALRAGDKALRADPITTGSHAALWAAGAGYAKLVLFGIDGQYREIVEGAARRGGIELEIETDAPNPNYFFDGYQRAGDRYNIPNPRPGLHVEAWAAAARELARDGVVVVNGNERSEVRFFPFVPPTELLQKGASPMNRSGVARIPDGAPAAAASAHWWRAQGGIAGFFRRQRVPLAIGAAIGAAAALAAWLNGVPGALIVSMLARFGALLLLVLFVRNAVSVHVERLEARIAALEAAVNQSRRERAR